MSVDQLQTLSVGAFVLSGVFFLLAVALFFLYRVPKLLGDISGNTAKKAIENIRQQNTSTGDKAYKPSAVNLERGKITDKMTASGRLQKRPPENGVAIQTEKLHRIEPPISSGANVPPETTFLQESPSRQTTLLQEPPSQQTTVLTGIAFGAETSAAREPMPQFGNTFTVEAEMSFLGSTEIIE